MSASRQVDEVHHPQTEDELKTIVAGGLASARKKGVSDAKIAVRDAVALSVTARDGDVDKVEYNNSRSFGVTVYMGKRSGGASSTDLNARSLDEAIQKAIHIAKYTEEDPCNGLAESDLLATKFGELNVYEPREFNADLLIEEATTIDNASVGYHEDMIPSDGCAASMGSSISVFGTTNGFLQSGRRTRHSRMAEAVAVDSEGNKKVEWWTQSAVSADRLDSPEEIGHTAASRAHRQLGPRVIKKGEYAVVLENRIAAGLIADLIGAIAGGSLYRKASYLLDSMGKQVAHESLTVREDPYLPDSLASRYWDDDGVQTTPKLFIENGKVSNYCLSTYSARRLGMQTTGNAGGTTNLFVDSPDQKPLEALLKDMGTGLLITMAMGQGADIVTGVFSAGALGFWVENGEIQFPVENITIGGHMNDILSSIQAYGSDIDPLRSLRLGSLLIEKMAVAAA